MSDELTTPIFVPTPGEQPTLEISTVSLEMGGKRGLPDYSSITAGVTVWTKINPGSSNQELHEALLALKDMMAADLAAIFDDARAVTTGSTVTKREVRMLGLPLIDSVGGAVVDAEATHTARGGKKASAPATYTLPEYKVVDTAEAKKVVKVTANGHTAYGDMTAAELSETIDRIEAAMIGYMVDKTTLPAGATMEMLEYRRNAAHALLVNKTSSYQFEPFQPDLADLDDVEAGIDPRDGMPFGDK